MTGAANDRSAWNSLYLVAKEAFEKNELDQVEEKCQACVDAAQQLDHDPALVAISLQILGEAYKVHGRFGEAESVVGQAYTIYEQEVGFYSENVLDVLLTLAELDVLQGRFARAECKYKQVLDIAHCVEITDPKRLAGIYENLAICLPEGRERERERFLKYALSLYESVEPNSPANGGTCFNLGECLLDLEKFDEAKSYYQKTIAFYDLAPNIDRLALAHAWKRLGDCLEREEKYEEAEVAYNKALTAIAPTPQTDDLLTASIYEQLAYCYERLDRLETAESFSRKALEIYEEELGPADIQSATSMHSLANLCCNQGKYASAELLLKRACAVYETTYGRNHTVVAGAYECMAAIFECQRDFEKALEYHRHSIAIYRECEHDPYELWAALLALAACLYETQQDAEAEGALKEAVQIEIHHKFEKQEARAELIALYQEQGRHKAAKLLGQAVHRHPRIDRKRHHEISPASPKHDHWKEVADARANYFETLIGPLPEESIALRNLNRLWTGKLIQFWGRKLNDVWVTSSYGLTNSDMPTLFQPEETEKNKSDVINRGNISVAPSLKTREPLMVPPELAGYGYELLLLTDAKETWPIYFLNMIVPCEILHDIELLRQVRKFDGLTIEAANIHGIGELHFLIMPAIGRLPSKVELPNGEMHLLVATRITTAEMDFGKKHGRRALLEQLIKAGLGQLSIVDRPSIL